MQAPHPATALPETSWEQHGPGADGHNMEGGGAAGQGLCSPSVCPAGKVVAGVWLSW